jgi:hypothetical protein
MKSLDEALKALQENTTKPANSVGPQGGNLSNPAQHPEWRKSEFKGSVQSGLHRFVDENDVANAGLKNEQVWHRMAAFMLIAGRTNSEIAMAAGVQPGEVAILKQQRWFQELCATIANEEGEEILGVLKSEAVESIQKLVTLRDFAESESIQFSAARTLIEQACGKPVQKVISDVTSRRASSPQEEMEQLKNELAALRNRNPQHEHTDTGSGS